MESETGACRFGTEVSEGTVLSSSLMRCRCPDLQAGEVTVEVSSNGQDFSIDGKVFRYIRGMVVYEVEPSKGSTAGGTTVTVMGTDLVGGREVSCLFGEKRVKGEVVNVTRVVCVAPGHEEGLVDVRLQEEGGGDGRGRDAV